MNISSNDDKIEKYLDELADEYKRLLFNALLERSSSIDEPLSISELLRLDNEIKKPLLRNYQRQLRRKRLFLIVGMTYMLLGFLLFFLYQIYETNFLNDINKLLEVLSISIAFFGVFLSVLSYALPTVQISSRSNKYQKEDAFEKILEYEVISKWRDLEGTVDDFSTEKKAKPPRSIIDYLYESNLINSEEKNVLLDFLKMRNNIVHSAVTNYSSNELVSLLKKVDKILEKLKTLSS